MRRTATRVIAVALAWFACITPAAAHNQSIHQQMTDLAYQMMVFVGQPELGDLGEGDAEWTAFLQRVAATPIKYKAQP